MGMTGCPVSNSKCIDSLDNIVKHITSYDKAMLWQVNSVYKSLYQSALLDIHTQCIFVNKQTIKCSNLTMSVLLSLRLITL